MDHSSEHDSQPSQDIVDGMPEGYPPTRQRIEGVTPMAGDLQKRLAQIAKQNLGECPDGSVADAYHKKQ